MSCVDSEGMKRDYEKGLTVKEIAEQYLVTEDMVKHAIGLSEGELKKRIQKWWIDDFKHFSRGIGQVCDAGQVYNLLDEANKDIWAHTSTPTKFLNLGDYVLVDESILKKWLGERQK